jgi:hypothetical protein
MERLGFHRRYMSVSGFRSCDGDLDVDVVEHVTSELSRSFRSADFQRLPAS